MKIKVKYSISPQLLEEVINEIGYENILHIFCESYFDTSEYTIIYKDKDTTVTYDEYSRPYRVIPWNPNNPLGPTTPYPWDEWNKIYCSTGYPNPDVKIELKGENNENKN